MVNCIVAVWAFLQAWAAHWQWKELLVVWSRKVVKRLEGPIMTQLTLIGIAGWHLRLHFFHRGDGELYHSHPRGFISICLRGAYREKLCGVPGERLVQPGTITVRRATDRHNVEPLRFPCVTLALTTPVIRKWDKGQCREEDARSLSRRSEGLRDVDPQIAARVWAAVGTDREAMAAPAVIGMVSATPTMPKVISTLGIPGTGKSTLIRRLCRRFDATVFHVPTYAREHGFAEIKGPSGLLEAPGLIPSFLDDVSATLRRGTHVILDGFPRDLERVRWLAERRWATLVVLHLIFPGVEEQQFAASMCRQQARVAQGRPLAQDAEARTRAMLLHDGPVVAELSRLGYPVYQLDCLLPEEQVEQQAVAVLTL